MDNAVAIDVVPEPSTMLLFGMGAVGGLGIFVGRTRCGRGTNREACR
jgi:hypothetical protein